VTVDVVAGQNDELAVGVKSAVAAVSNPAHREGFLKARYLGVDACPRYGRRHVDAGVLAASIVTPPNTGTALALLHGFWADRRPIPQRTFTTAAPYPASSAPASP
jgi:hypothetical protein